MKIKFFSIFVISILLFPSCRSSQFYFQENNFFHSKHGSIYENIKPRDKIVVLSKSNYEYKGRFVHIEDDILRAEEKHLRNEGPIYEIPLTEVHYIKAYKTSVVGNVALGVSVVGLTAIVVHATREW